ncbi:MAG TPA: PilZ domain-containing protein [Vicinamibacteria bacterium]|jgi:hypothetical protein
MSETGTQRGNRRLSARRACRLTVRYKAEGGWHPATAMDLSQKGCRLRVGEDLARGGDLTVAFEAPISDQQTAIEVAVPGTVIWSRREGLSYQAGVLFSTVPDALNEILGSLG